MRALIRLLGRWVYHMFVQPPSEPPLSCSDALVAVKNELCRPSAKETVRALTIRVAVPLEMAFELTLEMTARECGYRSRLSRRQPEFCVFTLSRIS